ncbi:hypothetical protein BRM1_08840 [Brevibacterium sp. BRM-1]|uniref:hypothetical protein n=1 Tax=Brevibacterium sp. BRM-1 TaxID=2999062 RepID=UPI00227F9D7D|nr:hypothetical protein [Brevibacterium sp. BRM-1]WAL39385.1 hypothetical protein BRM1_08840 [Brevibacterium sp. BRM-1]
MHTIHKLPARSARRLSLAAIALAAGLSMTGCGLIPGATGSDDSARGDTGQQTQEAGAQTQEAGSDSAGNDGAGDSGGSSGADDSSGAGGSNDSGGSNSTGGPNSGDTGSGSSGGSSSGSGSDTGSGTGSDTGSGTGSGASGTRTTVRGSVLAASIRKEIAKRGKSAIVTCSDLHVSKAGGGTTTCRMTVDGKKYYPVAKGTIVANDQVRYRLEFPGVDF